jgi:SOS-response transcriptional repressor LexA
VAHDDSERKRQVLACLKAAVEGGGRFPTADELKATSLAQLAAQKRRRETSPDRRMTLVPIVGSVCAGFGEPVEPVEMGAIPVDLEALSIKSSSRTFALKVRGDSMTGAQISDGDLVIVEAREPRIGDIVAALIDGETTLKRFVIEDGELFLKAENPRYPNLIPLRELVIHGVVRAVVRVCDPSRVTI